MQIVLRTKRKRTQIIILRFYPDDIALTATGKHPRILSDSLLKALNIVISWCWVYVLDVNPVEVQMIPNLKDKKITLSIEIKYLRTILDSSYQ